MKGDKAYTPGTRCREILSTHNGVVCYAEGDGIRSCGLARWIEWCKDAVRYERGGVDLLAESKEVCHDGS